MKQIYIAAPFFNSQQLTTVKGIEAVINSIAGLKFYSPRLDGVLQDMPAYERKNSLKKIFDLNVDNIINSSAVLAILDERDTGTTWEMGFAAGLRRPIFGYTSSPAVKLNVMLRQCMVTHACGLDEARLMLEAFSRDEVWTAHQVGDTF